MPMVPVTDPPAGVVVDSDASDNMTVIRRHLNLKYIYTDLSLNLHGTDKEGSKVLDEATTSPIQQALEFGGGNLDFLNFYQALEFGRVSLDKMMLPDFYPTLGRSRKGLLGRSRKGLLGRSRKETDVFGFGRFRFSVSSSPEGGIAIKFGSRSLAHLPTQCSVHHPVLQMVLFATHFRHRDRPWLWTSEMATAFIGIIKKLSSDACRSVVRPVYEAGWVFDVKKHSAKPCKGEAYALATTPSPTPDHGSQTPVLWLDSGAAHHVVCDDKLLTNLRAPPAGNAVTVTVADGFELPVVKIGDIRTAHIQIEDVYLVPGLQMNLVSVRQLTRSQIFTTFYENHAELWRGGEQVGGAITDDDTSLYRLRFLTEI